MTWDLSPLYAGFDDPAFLGDFDACEARAKRLIQDIGEADGAQATPELAETLLREMERVAEQATKVCAFVMLTLATDATNAPALRLHGRVNGLQLSLQTLQSALARFAGAIPDLKAIMGASPFLAQYAYLLETAAKSCQHLMPSAIEPWMLRMQLSGGRAWESLYEQLVGTHMVSITVDGQDKRLPLPAVRNMAYEADAATRKAAYEAELAGYKGIETAIAATLGALKGEALTVCEAKGYPSVLAQMLDEQHVDAATLDALLAAIRESLPDFRRYLKAKAKLLGHPNGLPFYDLFAPMGAGVKTYTADEARDYLVDVLGAFTPDMGAFVARAFAQRWIDLYPREGKAGGAFCAGLYPIGQSRILTNFAGSFGDISTLAHELGHGYHNVCLGRQPILNADTPMVLAETASIFNETFVTHHALAHATPEEAFTLLEAHLMESTQVIVDIYSRYLFETEVFETRKTGTMTADDLKDAMLRAQKESYGDGLDPEALHSYMWLCKSHYYSVGYHFYNYPYAFGLLFGLGVFAQYQAQGDAFVPTYEKLLGSTGTADVADVAASVGMDVRDIAFWRGSLAILKRDIDQFVALADSMTRGA